MITIQRMVMESKAKVNKANSAKYGGVHKDVFY